jgi:hypothetical protein
VGGIFLVNGLITGIGGLNIATTKGVLAMGSTMLTTLFIITGISSTFTGSFRHINQAEVTKNITQPSRTNNMRRTLLALSQTSKNGFSLASSVSTEPPSHLPSPYQSYILEIPKKNMEE